MARCWGCAVGLSLWVASAATAQVSAPLLARILETRHPEKTDPQRLEYDRVRREVGLDNFMAYYEAFVRAAQDDAPINAKYGDHFFGCDFGRLTGNGGWDRWGFVSASAISPQGKAFPIIGHQRQRGLVVLSEGARAVADFLWELPRDAAGKSPGVLGVRLLKQAGDREWVTVEVYVTAATNWTLGSVAYSCYPYNTSKTLDAARERWVATNTRELPTADRDTALQPAKEWALMLHNRLSQEDGGCLLVLDPAQVQELAVHGTYAIVARLSPLSGSKAVRAMLGYWQGRHWAEQLPRFRQAAPARRDGLVAQPLNLRADEIWSSGGSREDYQYLLGLDWLPEELRAPARQAWEGLQQLRGEGQGPLTHAQELAFVTAAGQCQSYHRQLREAWLANLGQLIDRGP